MKKLTKLALLSGILLIGKWTDICAQTLKPAVIATSGGYSSAAGVSLSWTMGETFTHTLQSGNTILTQGFQQPLSSAFYEDTDGDGYGNPAVSVQAISAPTGYVTDNTDCVDNNAAIHPGATEICNNLDDDCDGSTDEGAVAPLMPAAVIGPVNVCAYAGTGQQLTYSVAPVPNAAGYQWTVPPTVSIVSGQGSNSLIVTISTGFISNANKLIKVKATSACGNSADKFFYLVAQLPGTPTPVTGPTNICPIIGTANTATYTIPAVAGASAYIWTAQPGTTTITHPNGSGANDITVNVSFAAGFTTSPITVQSVNTCGTSAARSLTIVKNAAATPGLISGPTNSCPYILPAGIAATYTIAAVAGATSYDWTAPAGCLVTHPNGTGANDNTITVQYPNGFTSGSITVTATNGCGTGGTRSLAISKLNPATPGVIDVIQTAACPNRVYTYTIAAMPSNAVSILWTIPVDALSFTGQGTTSIVVSYPQTAVTGTVTATAVSNCANSVTRQSAVKLPACPPGSFSRGSNDLNSTIKAVDSPLELEVTVMPNPSVNDFKLQVRTSSKEQIHVRLLDVLGREFNKFTTMPGETKTFGHPLKSGVYIIEVRQGDQITTQRLVKL